VKDLEVLVLEVADDRVRPLAHEAVRAYQAGAMRSAVVSLWIAVLMDLTLKLRHLADGGDADARDAIDKLDKALEANSVAGVQKYERELLVLVGPKLEMLSPRETMEMERLYADRNQCAHPSFVSEQELFSPTPELVRNHLAAAAGAVFSQVPTAGKRLVALLTAELSGDSWPRPVEGSLTSYVHDRYLKRAKESSRRQVLQVLIKSALRVDPAAIDLKTAQNAREALQQLAVLEPHFVERELKDVLFKREQSGALTDAELARSCGAFGCLQTYTSLLPGTAYTRLTTLLRRAPIEVLIEARFFAGGRPHNPELGALFDNAIQELGSDDLDLVLKYVRDKKPFVGRTLTLVSESRSYRVAEQRLRLLERCSKALSPDHIRSLRDAITDNPYDQIGKASATPSILVSMLESGPLDELSLDAWQDLFEQVEDTSIVETEDRRYSSLGAAIESARPF
jgi:hypothetical protein